MPCVGPTPQILMLPLLRHHLLIVLSPPLTPLHCGDPMIRVIWSYGKAYHRDLTLWLNERRP